MITDEQIYRAFELELSLMQPPLPTVYMNRDAPAGIDLTQPYQKCWLMPVSNQTRGLQRKRTLHSGIFQVNLCYPSGKGTDAVGTRAGALQAHFFAGRSLVVDGKKILITARPSVALPTSLSPYTVPVSIDYECNN
jgi:hypothetical protein